MRSYIFALIAVGFSLLSGCEKGPAPAPTAPSSSAPSKPTAHASPIDLGEATLNGMKIKASRDKGVIRPGGDAPIDIWINGGRGDVAAVRFWIGSRDAKTSRKARADVENGHWHTHSEVPNPIPVGSKLWVEVEDKAGMTHVESFDLKV